MTDSTSPAGGFRVDAPQLEKSRQEEAPLDLDTLERLAAAATPPPWESVEDDPSEEPFGFAVDTAHSNLCRYLQERDAQFIAAADPSTIRALVGEVRRLGEAAVRWETRAHTAGAELAELRERAQHEEQDAGAAETYAAEINDGHLLALAQVRRWAWQDVLRLIKPKSEDIPHEHRTEK